MTIPALGSVLSTGIKWFIKKMVTGLIAIEAGWKALKDYFLTINPYFNYAFHVDGNYFLIMDTGHDCIRARYLWDSGDKKLGRISIADNTIGFSPDTMAFYDINEYYPYSQISWLDRIQDLINRMYGSENKQTRIIIGVHTPPVNLSKKTMSKSQRKI